VNLHKHFALIQPHWASTPPNPTLSPSNTPAIMPSLFSKFTGGSSRSKSKNPYSNPHHPSHAPLPKQPAAPSQPLPTASPRGSRDYLAEARELANRDPVTGQRLPQPNMPRPAQQSSPSTDTSAYQNRAGQTAQTTGSRCDLFSSQERERLEREEAIRVARGRAEFYAPERRVEEFYSEPVRY